MSLLCGAGAHRLGVGYPAHQGIETGIGIGTETGIAEGAQALEDAETVRHAGGAAHLARYLSQLLIWAAHTREQCLDPLLYRTLHTQDLL